MPRVVSILLVSLAIWVRSRLALQMELIALRHQVVVYLSTADNSIAPKTG